MKIERVSPTEVFQWVNKLNATRRRGEWWDGEGVVSGQYAESATGAFVAHEGGEIVGGALFQSIPAPMLIGVFVSPSYRRKGIGALLTRAVVETLLAEQREKVIAEVCDMRAFGMIEKLPRELRAGVVVRDVLRDI